MAKKLSNQLAGERMISTQNTSNSNDTVDQTRWVTLTLAVLSALSLLFVRWNSFLHQSKWILIVEYLALASTIALYWALRNKLRKDRQLWVGVGFAVVPVLSHFVMRSLDLGEATEILMLQVCQNIALFNAAQVGKGNLRNQGLSVLFGFFLVFFVTTISESLVVFTFTIPYVVLGIWWLMVRHWSRLEVHMPANVRSHFNVRSSTFITTVLLLAVTATLIGWNHQTVTRTIKGIMPTSGGNRYSDRYARGGVGDGDFFVAARNRASTVGPVESDVFLESTKPTLFDVMQENYQSPKPPKPKKSERALSPDDVKIQHAHEKIIQSEQSGRTFRTLRGAPEENRQVTEKNSNALFYVTGPTPIRLALNYYDQFDGLDWTVSDDLKVKKKRTLVGDEINDEFWVRFRERKKPISRDKQGSAQPTHPFLQGYENHSVKIMRLSTNRLLLPSSNYAWHFDKCDDTSYFKVDPTGAVQFAGRDSIPEHSIYHLVSRGVNYGKLMSQRVSQVRSTSIYARLPSSPAIDELSKIAAELTRDVRNDWQKVNVVLNYLKSQYRLDRASQNDEAISESSIEQFVQTKSGPDYMFATVASCMLRSLNMETRLVNGFFVGKANYDVYSAQSIVHSSDMHFWLEVRPNGIDWVTVEPTPGYPPPRTKMTVWQRVVDGAYAVWSWIETQWILCSILASGVILVLLFWRQIRFCIEIFCWMIAGWGSIRRRVLATIHLLERRASRTGRQGMTVDSLCHELTNHPDSNAVVAAGKPGLFSFIKAANQILYRSEQAVSDSRDLRQACFSLAFLAAKGRVTKHE